MDIVDRSIYLKGLLILIGRDHVVSDVEKESMLRIGKILGFERGFCENALSELLENPFLGSEPVRFTNPDVARSFLRDALRIACSVQVPDERELEWLRGVAEANSVDPAWFDDEMHRCAYSPSGLESAPYAAETFAG